MSKEEKIIKIHGLLLEVNDYLVDRFFDTYSEKLLDEKIDVLTQLKNGKTPSKIKNYYDILELYPKEDWVIWD